jgi:hypothetical protein
MDGKILLLAFTFFGAAVAVFVGALTARIAHSSKRRLHRVFIGSIILLVLSIIFVVVTYEMTPDVPAAVKQSLEAAIRITDTAKFRGKHWHIFGEVPKDFISAGGNSDTSLEDLTIVQQPREMITTPPTGQYTNATKDLLRIMATNVANRLLYTFNGTQDPQWPMLQSDAKAIFAEVMHRLPTIDTNSVYIKYRTGYEAVCGVNHHQEVDKEYAHDAAIYLMILVEALPTSDIKWEGLNSRR